MLPFDDRLPTDCTNGGLAIREWTPLPPSQCYPRPALDPTERRGDPTIRRCPPPVAADQSIVDHVELAAVTQEEERLLIFSGASFTAPDLDGLEDFVREEAEAGQKEEPLLIKSGATFPAPDLDPEPGYHELEHEVPKDRSPLLIKSGATYPSPDLDLDETATGAETALELPSPSSARAVSLQRAAVWRWCSKAVVVLVPVIVIVGLVLATAPPKRERAAAPTTHVVAKHGFVVPLELPVSFPAQSAPEPRAALPKSVPAAPERPTINPTINKEHGTSRVAPRTRLRRLLYSARRSVRQRRWSRARSRAVAALRVKPQHRGARKIQRLAERKLRQHRRHLASARKAMKRGQWSRARAHAAAALKVDPRDRRIKRLAERRLRRRPRG